MIASQLSIERMWEKPTVVDDGLRPYQEECVSAVFSNIAPQERRIARLFTGAGKTRTGIAGVRRWLAGNNDSALWLANRTFLIEDALERLRPSLGFWPGREQAAYRSEDSRMTVGSCQTFVNKRLAEMDPDRYGLIVVDECQVLDSPGGYAIRDHFKRAAFVGLSATPGDAKAFGGREAIKFSRNILWGMEQGYFVTIKPWYEKVTELSIADVHTVDGDLQITELEKKVAAAAIPIAKLALKCCEDRPTIIYTPGVASAHAVAKWLNGQREGCAVTVDAKTKPAVRRQVLRDFDAGVIQFIVNCGIYLYGLDVPKCRAIVIARPTEDRDLWEQMVGLGGRPTPGLGELPEASQRLDAIAASSKPDMLLLILTGDQGKHSLCDVGDLDEEAPKTQRDRSAREAQKSPGKSVQDILRDAKAWQSGENDRIKKAMDAALLQSIGGKFDPFAKAQKTKRDANAPHWTSEPATVNQMWWLKSHGLPTNISKGEAHKWRGRYEVWVRDGKRGDWKQNRQPGEEG